ncbi:MAG: SRPBCC family protein [Planctomycetota bacterium]
MRILAIRESMWLNAPPGEVWRRLLSLEEWPSWNSAIANARWRGRRGWKEGHRFHLSYSRRLQLSGGGRVSGMEPDEELSWHSRFLTFPVVFRLQVRPDGEGTEATFLSQYQGLGARFASRDAMVCGFSMFHREFLTSLRETCEQVAGRME